MTETTSDQSIPYQWEQTKNDLTVTIIIPHGITGKQINIKIEKDHLLAGIKGQEPIIDGQLSEIVKPSECEWTICDGKDGRELQIILIKNKRFHWWKSLIVGHPEIDVNQIEQDITVDDLDDIGEGARRCWELNQHDERKKQLEEIKKREEIKQKERKEREQNQG